MNAAALKMLADKGFTVDEIVAFAHVLESAEKRSSGAARQARYRGRKKAEGVTGDVTSDVTCDVTSPPKNISNPCSVSDETGAEAPDPVKELFDLGVAMLKSQGHGEREARSLLGSWRKGRSPGDVVAALVDARTRSISNLVEWMPKRLAQRGSAEPSDFVAHYAAEQKRLAAAGARQ